MTVPTDTPQTDAIEVIGLTDTPPQNRTVGIVVGARGLRGELRVRPFDEEATWCKTTKDVLLKAPSPVVPDKHYKMTRAHLVGPVVFMQLDGVNDRTMADTLKGAEVIVSSDQLPTLGADELYVDSLTGLTVLDADTLQPLGVVAEVLSGGAKDGRVFLDIAPPPTDSNPEPKTVCVPYQAPFIVKVDLPAQQLTLRGLTVMFESDSVS